MTTSKRSTKLSAVEAVAGDRDLMKALMKEALQEVLEGEMTEFPGSGAGRTHGSPQAAIGRAITAATW
jgi:putative transposase